MKKYLFIAALLTGGAVQAQDQMELGKSVYMTLCVACHQPTGAGLPPVFPPLTQTEYVSESPERFAAMIESHWDGIAAYCQPENKVSLGFVEGLNNKIRVIQRRAYGLRDEEFLRLKILTCMLPAI